MSIKKIPSIKDIRIQSPGKLKYDPFLYLPRKIAPYLTKLFCYTPITANQISLFLYMSYILSAFFIAVNRYIILSLILLHLSIILDCVDGRLARAKKQTSFLGLYFEFVTHETGPPLLFFALGSHLYLTLNNPIYLYLGGLIVIANLVIVAFGTSKPRIMFRHLLKIRKVPSNLIEGSSFLREAKKPFLRFSLRLINILPNFDVLIYAITIGYIFGFLKYILTFYFIYFCFLAFFKVVLELIIGFKHYGFK